MNVDLNQLKAILEDEIKECSSRLVVLRKQLACIREVIKLAEEQNTVVAPSKNGDLDMSAFAEIFGGNHRREILKTSKKNPF
jgi:hypothetical protein